MLSESRVCFIKGIIMKKIVKASFVCFIIIISFGLSTNVFAAKKTIKGNAYSRIYKKGSIVFCVAKSGRLGDNLYRVDLDKLKVKRIASARHIQNMQYNKGFVYYVVVEINVDSKYYLWRVNIFYFIPHFINNVRRYRT